MRTFLARIYAATASKGLNELNVTGVIRSVSVCVCAIVETQEHYSSGDYEDYESCSECSGPPEQSGQGVGVYV